MPAPITYAAIALMARDRLRLVRDALRAKESDGRIVNELERQVRYLAQHAFDMLSAQHPSVESPARLYGPRVADHVSKFALLGSVGPEFPGYAAMFAPGQAWMRDLLHKGTPDEHRERVVARSCDFAFNFWRIVQPLVTAAESNTVERGRQMTAMQAYVLGHFCHVAADLVLAPYIDNLHWRLGDANRPALSREQIVGALDVEVSRSLFQRGTKARGNDWADWWPSPGQVPDAFYEGYKRAIEDTFVLQGAPLGLAGYDHQRAKDQPPELSVRLLKDGFESFRNVLDCGAAWDYWDWLGATWFMYLPSLAALPLALALPNGRHLLAPVDKKPEGQDDDQGKFEIVALPFALNSLVTVYYSAIATGSYLGAESSVIFGWVSAAVQVVAAIAYFASLDAGKGSLDARWWLLFWLPLGGQLAHAIFTLIKGTRNPRRMQLAIAVLLPLTLSLLFIGMWWGCFHKGAEVADKEPGEFAWRFAVWFGMLFALWWLVPVLIRWAIAPRIDEPAANPLVSPQRHHIRLFDDSTLYMQPRGTSPLLGDLFFPSGRRELLKLWWPAPNPPSVKAHRDRIEFTFGAAPPLVFKVPPAQTKLTEFAAFLKRNVKNPADNAANLSAEPFWNEAAQLVVEDYELPPGLAFADEGDDKDTQAAHDAAVARAPQPLPDTRDKAYVLYHAPKLHQSVRFERSGPTRDQEQRTAAAAGVGRATSAAASRTVTFAGVAATPTVFTRATQLFKPGDILEAPVGGARRVVVTVDADNQVTVATPFPGGLAGVAFGRAARVFTVANGGLIESPPLAGCTVQQALYQPNQLLGAGPAGFSFGAIFRPGDTVRVTPAAGPAQDRLVEAVLSDTLIQTSRQLDPPLNPRDTAINPLPPPSPPVAPPPGPATPFVRLVTEATNLFAAVAASDDVFGDGDALMNEAADLAVLMCLGATSHLLTPLQRGRVVVGTGNDLERVYQVFRNWNLDRRRVNEWKMLVAGGALSEKRGNPAATDAALPPLHTGWTMFADRGEATANRQGWVDTLRSWVDMARRPETDTKADVAFKPGNPSNLDLSRALAFLLDARDPVPPT